jgi:carnitine 3-dehydrogenase
MIAAIIGGGVIGSGWTARFLLHGWDVNFFDPQKTAQARAQQTIAQARLSLGALYAPADLDEGELTFCGSEAEAVAGAHWVQESVPEQLDLKRQVLGRLNRLAPTDAIVASSTSGFTPSLLAQGLEQSQHQARTLVCHPFNPVYLLPMVEVVASKFTSPEVVARAEQWLGGVNMKPLRVRKEIDAHIADRLLEAVWREALWLIQDDVATTDEVDRVIRDGFGLRWAQMGLFETYRIAGGEAGMSHFLEQFGPALQWPWSRLTDVPELGPELVAKITAQSDAQSGHETIAQMEARRDRNLVAILLALAASSDAINNR